MGVNSIQSFFDGMATMNKNTRISWSQSISSELVKRLWDKYVFR